MKQFKFHCWRGILLTAVILILFNPSVHSYPGPYAGSRIMGANGVCAVYSESRRSSENEMGITHYYVGGYSEDFIQIALPFFNIKGIQESFLGTRNQKRNPEEVSIRAENFYVETQYRSLSEPSLKVSYKVYSTIRGIILFDISVTNTGSKSFEVGIQPMARFREKPLSVQSKEIRGTKTISARFQKTTIFMGFVNEPSVSGVEEKDKELTGLSIREMIPPGKTVRKKVFIASESGYESRTISPDSLEFDRAKTEWEKWIQSGEKLNIRNPEMKKAYESCLIALAATSLKGAVPADMTGQFLTDGKPQYYPRDALMTARALFEAGYTDLASEIVRFWDKSIPQKSPGEWYARYDATRKATPGGSGAPYDVPEWDSNGYYASLMLKLYQKTGEWAGDYELMKQLLDFVVKQMDSDGLVKEGGIVEWVGLLPATQMNLIAGLRDGALICALHHNQKKAKEYESAAARMEQGLKKLFSGERGAYMDYREGKEYLNTSSNFGFVWGYPDHFELSATNAWYRSHSHKLGGGVQYFEAEGYGSDCFGFTTGASALYHAFIGDHEKYKEHILWMMERSNLYGMMPERIYFPNGQDVSPASPLSWCNGEFVAALLQGARLHDPFVGESVGYSLDWIFSELQGLKRIVLNLPKENNLTQIQRAMDAIDKVLTQDRKGTPFFNRASMLHKGLNEVVSIADQLKKEETAFVQIERILNRLKSNLNRILCNDLNLKWNLSTYKESVPLKENITVSIRGKFPDAVKLGKITVERSDGNEKIIRTVLPLNNKDNNIDAFLPTSYVKGTPPYETAVRATVFGSWKGIPISSDKTILLNVIERYRIQQDSNGSGVTVRVHSNVDKEIKSGLLTGPGDWNIMKQESEDNSQVIFKMIPKDGISPGFYPFEFKPNVAVDEKYGFLVPYQTHRDISGDWFFQTGDQPEWSAADYNDKDWKKITVPKNWEEAGFPDYDGYAWYRTDVSVPKNWAGHDLKIILGAVDDQDWTYWNGKLAGHTEVWNQQRDYVIAKENVRFGKTNKLAVRVYDGLYGGGIWKPPLRIEMVPDEKKK